MRPWQVLRGWTTLWNVWKDHRMADGEERIVLPMIPEPQLTPEERRALSEAMRDQTWWEDWEAYMLAHPPDAEVVERVEGSKP